MYLRQILFYFKKASFTHVMVLSQFYVRTFSLPSPLNILLIIVVTSHLYLKYQPFIKMLLFWSFFSCFCYSSYREKILKKKVLLMVKFLNIGLQVAPIVLSIFAFLIWLWFCFIFPYLREHIVLYSEKIMPSLEIILMLLVC